MNDNYPRMKNFFYWHRPNIILSISIYEYVLICIAIISVYHLLSNFSSLEFKWHNDLETLHP